MKYLWLAGTALLLGCSQGITSIHCDQNPGAVKVDSVVYRDGKCLWYGENHCTFDGTYWVCVQ